MHLAYINLKQGGGPTSEESILCTTMCVKQCKYVISWAKHLVLGVNHCAAVSYSCLHLAVCIPISPLPQEVGIPIAICLVPGFRLEGRVGGSFLPPPPPPKKKRRKREKKERERERERKKERGRWGNVYYLGII